MERYMMRIDGKVQGVWFRQSTLKKAKELGLGGFVQNEDGGSVYVEAEGNKESLNALIAWCLDGPETASVKAITVVKGPGTGSKEFVVK
ncbi:MAG: acylphosphatase [Saprospiraceae bacterium]|jgi:acylphosphatase|nr:acylphosphatase [Saprospiraceae bacterium]